MGEEFRKNLAEQLSALPKDVRRSALDDARKDERYWQEREEYLRNKSEEVEEGNDILVKKKILYYGADHPGITSIRKAENTSVGNGVYLTPQSRAAVGYAKTHGDRQLDKPTIYEVIIENLRLANLRANESANYFLKEIRPKILERLQKITEETSWIETAANRRMLEQIDVWLNGQRGTKKDYGHFPLLQDPELFTSYLQSLGYDGLVAEEYEPTPGFHETYLIFDPNKVKIKQEQIVN